MCGWGAVRACVMKEIHNTGTDADSQRLSYVYKHDRPPTLIERAPKAPRNAGELGARATKERPESAQKAREMSAPGRPQPPYREPPIESFSKPFVGRWWDVCGILDRKWSL